MVLGRAWSWGVVHSNNRSRLFSRWFRKTQTWTPSEVHGQICWVSSLDFMVRVTFNLRSLGGKSFPRMLLHLSRAKTQTFEQPSSIPQDTQCLSDFPAAGCLPSLSPLYTTTVSTAHPHQQLKSAKYPHRMPAAYAFSPSIDPLQETQSPSNYSQNSANKLRKSAMSLRMVLRGL